MKPHLNGNENKGKKETATALASVQLLKNSPAYRCLQINILVHSG
jgi:hypothetical protein